MSGVSRRTVLGGVAVGAVAQLAGPATAHSLPRSDHDAGPHQPRPGPLEPPQGRLLQGWRFDRGGDLEGWTVPPDMTGLVMGGAVWLTLNPIKAHSDTVYQIWGDVNARLNHTAASQVASPAGLNIAVPATESLAIRLRVRNLSPTTDLFLRWRSAGQAWSNAAHLLDPLKQTARAALKPDEGAWQEVVCFLDGAGPGPIDQVALFLPERLRGDIWIDLIEIVQLAKPATAARPNIRNAPLVDLPGIDQHGFEAAFEVLQAAMVTDVPKFGFNYPFISPGAGYQIGGWWLMDSSIALAAVKWTSQPFAENVMRGFEGVQQLNPDGRLDLWGHSAIRGMPGDVSQIPLIFSYAADIARRTEDVTLRVEIYGLMRRYLDWWLSPVKRDGPTGLVSSLLEETLGAGNNSLPGKPEFAPQTVAGVDTNVAVALGARLTADLAQALGRLEECAIYRRAFQGIAEAINRYMWDEQNGIYYNYDLVLKRLMRDRIVSSTFHPLKCGIAPSNRRKRLIARLTDPAEFNWGIRPLTTLSKRSADYVEARGVYDGRGWYGDIWALRNQDVVTGLLDVGENELAAELNWETIREFHNNYYEFLTPADGAGQGQKGFAWTASLYVAAIVDVLFGIQVDAIKRQIIIRPCVPKSLFGRELTVRRLRLPMAVECFLDLAFVQHDRKHVKIEGKVSRRLPEYDVIVGLPDGTKVVRGASRSFKIEL
jgi:hypothetical protein